MSVFSPAAAASRAASWCPPAASAPSPSTRPCAPPGSDLSPCPESGGETPAVTLSAHSDSWEDDKQQPVFHMCFSRSELDLSTEQRGDECAQRSRSFQRYPLIMWIISDPVWPVGFVEADSSQYISNNLWLLAVCLHTNINHTTCYPKRLAGLTYISGSCVLREKNK